MEVGVWSRLHGLPWGGGAALLVMLTLRRLRRRGPWGGLLIVQRCGLGRALTSSWTAIEVSGLKPVSRLYLRVLEPTHPSKLLTLHTSWEVRVTLNLLLAASDARNSKPLPWLSRLGHTPVGVDGLAIDDRPAVSTVVVEVAQALSWYLGLPHEAWEELGSAPDLWSESVLARLSRGRGVAAGIPVRWLLGLSSRPVERGGRVP